MTIFFSEQTFFEQVHRITPKLKLRLHTHTEVDSTSTELLRLLADGAPSGTVVVAQRQTGGRGRSGNQWHSASTHNLYLSVATHITGKIATRLPLVPLAAGVAAAVAVNAAGISDVMLKWPNDLLCHRKKVGGILCETPGIENDSAMAVVGMGINLGEQSFPPELQHIAAYLTPTSRPAGKSLMREQIAAYWVSSLHEWCASLMNDEATALINVWKTYCEPFGRRVKVGDVVGETIDLNESGRLLVRQDNGEICTIPGGMVEPLD